MVYDLKPLQLKVDWSTLLFLLAFTPTIETTATTLVQLGMSCKHAKHMQSLQMDCCKHTTTKSGAGLISWPEGPLALHCLSNIVIVDEVHKSVVTIIRWHTSALKPSKGQHPARGINRSLAYVSDDDLDLLLQ